MTMGKHAHHEIRVTFRNPDAVVLGLLRFIETLGPTHDVTIDDIRCARDAYGMPLCDEREED